MRPVKEIPADFFEPKDVLGSQVPLVESYLETVRARQPLAGATVLLIQHQLANQIPLARALVELGVTPESIYWLDIPYTSTSVVREYVQKHVQIPSRNFVTCSDYRVLDAYGPYQHARTLRMLLKLIELDPASLIVLDDGAYALEALAALGRTRWPRQVALVEQTTRGLIKMDQSASLRALTSSLPIVNVAGSPPKRLLEPPFIAMGVCASLELQLARKLRNNPTCLVLGYGAIGEQVCEYLASHFEVPRSEIFVDDVKPERLSAALKHGGYRSWQRDDLSQQFDVVIGCSGQGSFQVGDQAYLRDGALLVSASSGAVELSRRDFIELADASSDDDIMIERSEFDAYDVHARVPFRFVDRTATFVNAGFPVNFDGRASNIPDRYIQPTPTMMLAAAVQAAQALREQRHGLLPLDPAFCKWLGTRYSELLGPDVKYLPPPPPEAW